jgi:uncharacterized protein (TIGR02466 family)
MTGTGNPVYAGLFETPLILDAVPDSAALNAALRDVILARRQRDAGVRKSNWSGWQSATDMAEWGGAAAGRLIDHFLSLCDRFTAVAPGSVPNFLWEVQMWANLSGPGAANEAHVHPGAVWSAVYYVEDGLEAGEDRHVGGDLVLYDPRMPAVRMLPFDLRHKDSKGQLQQSFYPLPPVEGRIVMFPPWLYHSVHPYHGVRERISVAMNANAIPPR